jgi:hypothetical protein
MLIRKIRRKQSPRKPRSRWENDIKMVRKDIRFKGADWINLAYDRN